METKITSMNAMFLQHIVDADAEMKRINDSVEQQSVEIVKLKDMKIPSDNKSQRGVNGTHNDMVISESNTASETVLNEHKIVYASVQCYSKPDSSSKTFKVRLPPHQYRKLFNPSLWDSGICVKRFFNPRNT